MGRARFIALLGLQVVSLHSIFPALASAEATLRPRLALVADHSDDPVLGIVGTRAIEPVETPAPPVPPECRARYMVGSAVGVPLGVMAVVSGGGLAVAGGIYEQRAVLVWGSVLMVTGVVALGLSAWVLTKRRQARRRVCGLRERWP